jgi:hypothetical protein
LKRGIEGRWVVNEDGVSGSVNYDELRFGGGRRHFLLDIEQRRTA